MSTPLGHALSALALLEVVRATLGSRDGTVTEASASPRWPWVFALASLLPDLDVPLAALFGAHAADLLALGAPDGPHHGLLHAPAFAFLAGLLVFAGARRGLPAVPRRLGLALASALALHPFLDLAVGCGVGVPLLWPFEAQRYYSPWSLVPTAPYGVNLGGFLDALISRKAAVGLLLECLIFVPPYLAARRWRRTRQGACPSTGSRLTLECAALLLVSCAGTAATHRLL